jgi:hypothetical protein
MASSIDGPAWDEEPTSVLHKHPKTRGFVMLENDTVRDGRMSFRATGLLTHLLSLQEGARIGSVDLARHRPEGRVAIQSAYKELRAFGYVHQERQQNEDGKWRTVTHVYEVPPEAGNLPSVPDAGSPTSVNLPVSLTESKTKELQEERGQFRCVCGVTAVDHDAYMDHLEECDRRGSASLICACGASFSEERWLLEHQETCKVTPGATVPA